MENQNERLKIIDGLRFIAIVSVVLYHLYPHHFPGGFIGVDVFFTISGFIMYHKYGRDLLNRRVDFKQFFTRRVRRLLPAYFVFLLITSLFAFFILPPNILINFAQVLIANGVYLQNLVLFNQGDYFVEAYSRPLLHTWSLAIEEQFYLLFPLFILVLRKARQAEMILVLALILISAILAFVFSGISERMTFFLIPFRAWEFGIGFLAALIYRTWVPNKVNAFLSNSLGLIGVISIVFAVLFFEKSATFPGLQSSLALGGTCLVCIFQDKLLGTPWLALTNAISQHFGTISYSWYLWHWPFISFYYIQEKALPQGLVALCVLALGYISGVLSYNFIEKSVTIRALLTRGRAVSVGVLSFAIMSISIGTFFVLSKGAVFRYDYDTRPYVLAQTMGVGERCGFVRRVVMFGSSVCRRVQGNGRAPILLIGDSHSNMIRPLLTEMAREANRTLYVATDICRPYEFGSKFCRESYWSHLRADIEALGIKAIVLAARWPFEFEEGEYAEPIERLSDLGLHYFVMQSLPEGRPFNPDHNAFQKHGDVRSASSVAADFDRESYLDSRSNQLAALQSLSRRQDVSILRTAETVCPDEMCLFAQDGVILYMDDNHLSAEGASIVQPAFEQIFQHGF